MNLPSGLVVKAALDVAGVDFPMLVKELMKKGFNGYLSITIASGGVEEGTMVFDAGKIIACAYEYFRHDKTLVGDGAFIRVFNASAAKYGVIDIYQLSAEQVKLVLAFNEKAFLSAVPNEGDVDRLGKRPFSQALEDEVAGNGAPVASKEDVLRKYKLSGIARDKGTDITESVAE